MRRHLLPFLGFGAVLGILGCTSSEGPPSPGDGSGGNSGAVTGGNGATGGSSGTGGHVASSGGEGGVTTGGTRTGGSGGNSAASTGGASAMGGGSGAGRNGNGAVGGSTGSAGAGGASTGDVTCPPPVPRSGGKQYCGSSGSGTATGNYTYNLYSDGKGMGCITVYGVDAAFKAAWTNVGDWIGRVGLSFDKSKTPDQIGTLSSDFAYTQSGVTSGGFGNVGIYGWSVNPLHEYYIEENWLGKRPNFTKVGSFTIEGEGTYDVMTNMQKNQPNITGTNQDFLQFWSVRQGPRQCGHISISKHFAQWASMGMKLGNLEEARFSVEGQNNTGTIDFTTANVVVGK
jgi:hypothetical protein